MHCHARHRRELPPALWAHSRHIREVGVHVIFQALFRRQSLPALVAAEGIRRAPADAEMLLRVVVQAVVGGEPRLADEAPVRRLGAVQLKVPAQADGGDAQSVAELADVRRTVTAVHLLVIAQRIRIGEPVTVSTTPCFIKKRHFRT